MTAQQFLGRYRAAQVDMQRAERLIAKITALLEVQGVDTSNEKVQSSNIDDRTARLVAELVDARNDFEAARARAIRVVREINALIECISDPQQKRLLEMRYLEGKTWEEIANGIHVTYRHVFRMRRWALDAAEKLIYADLMS